MHLTVSRILHFDVSILIFKPQVGRILLFTISSWPFMEGGAINRSIPASVGIRKVSPMSRSRFVLAKSLKMQLEHGSRNAVSTNSHPTDTGPKHKTCRISCSLMFALFHTFLVVTSLAKVRYIAFIQPTSNMASTTQETANQVLSSNAQPVDGVPETNELEAVRLTLIIRRSHSS